MPGTKPTRRDLLARAAGLALLAGGAALLRRVWFPRPLDGSGRRTLEALLDTLLPPSPSWRETGVMPRLAAELGASRQGRRALGEGIAWLDGESERRHGAPFASLAPADRNGIVAAAAAEPPRSLPRFFYRSVRDLAMRLHWAHPAAWRTAGLAHAPQPEGYWDFEDAPRA